MMKSKVDYDVLDKFTDYEELYLEYDRVTNNIDIIDIDYGVDIIFKYYRKYGFPHYTIREEEKTTVKMGKIPYEGMWKEKPKRARGPKGRYKGDDKSTKDVNEAWVGGKAPKKKRK